MYNKIEMEWWDFERNTESKDQMEVELKDTLFEF